MENSSCISNNEHHTEDVGHESQLPPLLEVNVKEESKNFLPEDLKESKDPLTEQNHGSIDLNESNASDSSSRKKEVFRNEQVDPLGSSSGCQKAVPTNNKFSQRIIIKGSEIIVPDNYGRNYFVRSATSSGSTEKRRRKSRIQNKGPEHLGQTTSSDKSQYKCTNCGKTFDLKDSYQKHMISHSEDKKYKCDLCYQSFSFKSHISSHINTHLGLKLYECSICGKSFYHQSSCIKHELSHLEVGCHLCTVCDKPFFRKDVLRRHMLSHGNVKKFECQLCAKKFIRKDNLRTHLEFHIGIKNHVCNICNQSFILKTHLARHKLAHRNKLIRSVNW